MNEFNENRFSHNRECTNLELSSNGTNSRQTPSYNFHIFKCLAICSLEFTDDDNYLRGCKWSPNGKSLLTSSNDNVVRVFDLPNIIDSWSSLKNPNFIERNECLPITRAEEGTLVYDFEWHPEVIEGESTCFITSSQFCPIHMRRANSEKIIATYKGYNTADEVSAAYSVNFSVNGDYIYGGYKNRIEIFHTGRPGRSVTAIDTKKLSNQGGIISSIVNSPLLPNVIVAGSYDGSICWYTDDGRFLYIVNGHQHGITQLAFSADGNKLFSSARQDKDLVCWDLRNPGKALFWIERPHTTNQRIYFDLTKNTSHLLSGSTDGKIRIWDVNSISASNQDIFAEHRCHNDCMNGISVNHRYPVVATTSGQRHFPDISEDLDSDDFLPLTSSENEVKFWWNM